eukprot:jgi/Mesvir1/26983/Mv20695-RA.1
MGEVPPEVYNIKQCLGEDEKWWECQELQKLTLTNNGLRRLSEDLAKLDSLTLLDLSYNVLEGLPAAIGSLQQLKSLDVSFNKLCELPTQVASLPALVRLYCSSNQLRELPMGLGNCRELTELKAGTNRLQSLPPDLGYCHRLILLDIQENGITDLPDAVLQGLPLLSELLAARNRITVIPESIGRLNKLVRLDLRENGIRSVPLALTGCTALTELFLGYNALKRLPGELGTLKLLKVLDVRNNELTEFPDAACSLELNLLDLTNNNLSSLPPALGTMTTLRKLCLDGNGFRTIRSALVTGPTPNLLKYLRSRMPDTPGETQAATVSGNLFATDLNSQLEAAFREAAPTGVLNLSKKGLQAVPAGVWESRAPVLSLDLSGNSLEALPDELAIKAMMEVLLLADNKLTQWPPVLFSLPSLKQLSVARNPLRWFPEQPFAGLSCLESLDMTCVPGPLPSGPLFAQLPSLRRLHLRRMGLRAIPREIFSLKKLRILDLAENALASLPEDVVALTELEELDISSNDIGTLPPRLGMLHPVLRAVNVEGNPLRRCQNSRHVTRNVVLLPLHVFSHAPVFGSIRRQIIERGTKELLMYLKDKPCYQFPIMASGMGPYAAVDQVIAARDIRAQIFGAVPLLERVQLRGACHGFKSAVDKSLEEISELFWEDIADVAIKPGGLDWLLPKCPHLRTLSFCSRAAHQLPRDEREQAIKEFTRKPGTSKQSLLGLAHCRQLRSLTLAGSLDVDDNVLIEVAAACRDLERLDIRNTRMNTRINDAGITEVALHCRQLKELLVGHSKVTDESLQRIAERCRHLEQLVIVGTSVTDAGVSAIARRCPNLRHLDMDDSNVTDAGIATVAAHCPQLEYLGIEQTGPGLTEDSVIAIAQHCPGLRGLRLRNCPFTGVGLRAVADGCRQLESLDITNCTILGSAFAYLATRCPQLRRLNVIGDDIEEQRVHDDALLALGRNCRELRKLTIDAEEVSDDGIAALAGGCPSLEHLHLGICNNASDAGITAIAQGCPQLRYLELNRCDNVTDVCIRAIVRGCPQLRRLHLYWCLGVTDDGMVAIAENCPQLRELAVRNCGKVTDAGLRVVGEHCRLLEYLSCSLKGEVTDANMGVLAQNCTQLRGFCLEGRRVADQTVATVLSGPAAATLLFLDLSFNEGIMDDALLAVARACPILREFRVARCPKVTDVGIMAIAQGCRRLRVLLVYATPVTQQGVHSFDQTTNIFAIIVIRAVIGARNLIALDRPIELN